MFKSIHIAENVLDFNFILDVSDVPGLVGCLLSQGLCNDRDFAKQYSLFLSSLNYCFRIIIGIILLIIIMWYILELL